MAEEAHEPPTPAPGPPGEPAPVDVVQVMREIRESIRRKRAQGIYTDEEVESLTEVRLRSWAEPAELDPGLLERLLGPSHDWNVAADYPIRSHRTGPAARLIVLAKRLVSPLVRLYTDHVVKRQAQLNQYLYHLLHRSIRENVRLQVEVQQLRARVEALERERPAPPAPPPSRG